MFAKRAHSATGRSSHDTERVGMSKFEQVLQSRKVWASVVALLLLTALFYLNAISGETYAWGLTVVAGVFTGATALEDGLSAIFVRLGNELDVPDENTAEPIE